MTLLDAVIVVVAVALSLLVCTLIVALVDHLGRDRPQPPRRPRR
jgi:hypothetical protein